ncbi:DUF305 domain-containing protein [Nonomuraea angiospora]|uniref:Uncharacterized protein (DUF305 family) n=1 Tax=Nonomuraea angiospora TaxID=46172 RepID=A0ABR9MA71_9ACTN|nr:DUF305 domain-containing protein [Nonomuraea angiospora]MBE1589805.1 uncharacterized protein (DUF305 family) [Nonomuraea angiospora]
MRWSTAVVALLGLVLAAGCAASADSTSTHVQADVAFSQEMITHHQQTIQLAEVAAKSGKSPYVRDLSTKLIAEEKADIDMMTSWLESWKETVPPEPTDRMGSELKAGAGFDKEWLTALSGHLEHGVMMAETVKKSGKHGPTLELADKIITAQKAELAEIAKQAG